MQPGKVDSLATDAEQTHRDVVERPLESTYTRGGARGEAGSRRASRLGGRPLGAQTRRGAGSKRGACACAGGAGYRGASGAAIPCGGGRAGAPQGGPTEPPETVSCAPARGQEVALGPPEMGSASTHPMRSELRMVCRLVGIHSIGRLVRKREEEPPNEDADLSGPITDFVLTATTCQISQRLRRLRFSEPALSLITEGFKTVDARFSNRA